MLVLLGEKKDLLTIQKNTRRRSTLLRRRTNTNTVTMNTETFAGQLEKLPNTPIVIDLRLLLTPGPYFLGPEIQQLSPEMNGQTKKEQQAWYQLARRLAEAQNFQATPLIAEQYQFGHLIGTKKRLKPDDQRHPAIARAIAYHETIKKIIDERKTPPPDNRLVEIIHAISLQLKSKQGTPRAEEAAVHAFTNGTDIATSEKHTQKIYNICMAVLGHPQTPLTRPERKPKLHYFFQDGKVISYHPSQKYAASFLGRTPEQILEITKRTMDEYVAAKK